MYTGIITSITTSILIMVIAVTIATTIIINIIIGIFSYQAQRLFPKKEQIPHILSFYGYNAVQDSAR